MPDLQRRKMVVVELVPLQDPGIPATLLMRLDYVDPPIQGAEALQTFKANLPPWTTPAAVQGYGNVLQRSLLAHPAIQAAFTAALAAPPGSRPSIYFYIRTAQAEPFYWETLCGDDGKFWALDPGLPVGRMVYTGSAVCGLRPFAPPLRIMAVLSALGEPAAEEWQRLYSAVQDVRKRGLPIDLRVLLSETQLRADLAALGPAEVSADLLGPDPLQVQNAIGDYSPNLLHFFCHGTAGHGAPRLQLAIPADWATLPLTQATAGSISFAFSQLEHLVAVKDLWLVTLNCCQGGQATGDVHSLAYSLVAEAGVPAAIGMMEPIDAGDAHAFCGGLYGSLLRYLQLSLSQGSSVEIDWAQATYDPRLALSVKNQPPSHNRQWALPVLYATRDAFQVQPSGVSDTARLAGLASTAAGLAGLERVLPPEATPPAVRDDLAALVDRARQAWQPTNAEAQTGAHASASAAATSGI